MASRNSGKPSQGGHMTQQKSRKSDERGRASGGGLRSQPIDSPPGRSASSGGLTTRGMAKNDANSRSSNAGRQQRQKKQP